MPKDFPMNTDYKTIMTAELAKEKKKTRRHYHLDPGLRSGIIAGGCSA